MRTFKTFALVNLLLCSAFAVAQQTLPTPAARESQIRLDVVVTPKSGKPVAELRQQDFTILDNKVPEPVLSFKALGGGGEAPVEAVLVVDALNIPIQGVGRELGEIEKFLRANGGQLAVPASLAAFTENGFQSIGNTSKDGNALATALKGFNFTNRTIRRSQGFYGAEDRTRLSISGLQLLVSREAHQPGRKLIFWVSPGWPILSGPGVELDSKQQQALFSNVVDLSTLMRQAQVTLYSLDSFGVDESLSRTLYYKAFVKGASKPSQVAIGSLGLQVLAEQSGGLALSSTGVADLLERCIGDLSAYYEISFEAAHAESRDEYHQIEVKVPQPGMVVRAREGYYAQP